MILQTCFCCVRSSVLSLKQLIHSSLTTAEGLIEMFSHSALPRRRMVNHSSVVYSEISFGVRASAALFFTEASQWRLTRVFFLSGGDPPSYPTRPL